MLAARDGLVALPEIGFEVLGVFRGMRIGQTRILVGTTVRGTSRKGGLLGVDLLDLCLDGIDRDTGALHRLANFIDRGVDAGNLLDGDDVGLALQRGFMRSAHVGDNLLKAIKGRLLFGFETVQVGGELLQNLGRIGLGAHHAGHDCAGHTGALQHDMLCHDVLLI
jgi:hypothetical protein